MHLSFQKYHRLLIANQEGMVDNLTTVSLITDKPVEYWKQSTDRKEFNEILNSIEKQIKTLGEVTSKSILGIPVPTDLGYVACGVYEDAKIVAKKIHEESDTIIKLQYYPELIAGYFQWRRDGNYDSLLAKEMEVMIWKQPASDVINIATFFFLTLKGLNNGTAEGLPKVNTIMMKLKQVIKSYMKRLGL